MTKSHLHLRIGWLLIFLISSASVCAQLQVWRHINTAEMTNPNVNCITEDASGFMYFGTQEGLERFDGRRFHKIEVPDRLNKEVDLFTHALKWDRRGVLWVATRFHIYNYDPVSGAVHVVFSPANGVVTCIEIDSVRNRLYTIQSENFTAFQMVDTGLLVLYHFPLTKVTKLLQASNGELYALKNNTDIIQIRDSVYRQWFSAPIIRDMDYLKSTNSLIMLTTDGLQMVDLRDKTLTNLKPRRNWNLRSQKSYVTVLGGDRVFIQNAENSLLLNKLSDTGLIEYATDVRNPWSLRSNFLSVVYSDKHNNIWGAEDGVGITVLPANAAAVNYLPGTMIGAARLWKLYHDSDRQQVFASSENGLCAIHYGDGSMSYIPNLKPHGAKLFEVMDYIPMGSNELLLITNGQGSWLFNTLNYQFKSFTPLNRTLGTKGFWGARKIKAEEYLLFGANGLYLFNKKDQKLTEIRREENSVLGKAFGGPGRNEVYTVLVDSAGHIWLGSSLGIEILDSNFHVLKTLGGRNSGNNGLKSTIVLDIKQGGDGSIYIATSGGGVYKCDRDTCVPVPLAGNPAITYCIVPIDDKNLLVTTSKGMCLYNTVSQQSWLINEKNGMPIVDFNQLGLVADSRFVLAAGAKGVVLMDKKALFSCFHDTAQIHVLNGNKSISELSLKKGNHTIDLDATIAGYASGTSWKIEYKLDGLDDSWREMPKDEWHIHYNSIEPGSYQLHVRATDEQGVVWVSPVTIDIVAIPFYWQTFWFRGFVFCLCLGLIIVIVRYFSRLRLKWQLKKMEDEQKISRERLRISRELHDNVGSQLTYLITGLESSGMLLHKKETGILEQKIEHMQASARESMQQLRDAIWALNSESVATSVLFSRFETWLEKFMEAFPGINVSLENGIAEDVVLDPLRSLNLFRIMQEAVHNVVKHAGASALTISLGCANGQLTVSITDNGKGFNTDDKMGNGRRAMDARAGEMGAKYTVRSGSAGTEINLVVAIK